ncbi:hypothetical protein DVH24_042605 [Malus domestica]|uniref:Uncharacterized protein n=1 Tax=Malus domestica TaxID=3750 RepID=A0A498KPK3_MALDO|nr:hypothetical protein DVH24_042605 [Malus domestica]
MTRTKKILSVVKANNLMKPATKNSVLNDLFSNGLQPPFLVTPYNQLEGRKRCRIGSFFISASPGSFLRQIVPAKSLHFVALLLLVSLALSSPSCLDARQAAKH